MTQAAARMYGHQQAREQNPQNHKRLAPANPTHRATPRGSVVTQFLWEPLQNNVEAEAEVLKDA